MCQIYIYIHVYLKVKVTQFCPTLSDLMEYIIHGILQAGILEWVAFTPGDIPNAGTKSRSPALQADSLPDEPQGKLKNTGVGSLSLLQRIFLSQELNQGFLHCRQILYQLSYQGSPDIRVCVCVCVCILLKIFLKIIKSFSYFPLSVWIISCLLRKAIALE